jgi:hypothetical protein
MYKAFKYYSPYTSLFSSFPSLRAMPPKEAPRSLSKPNVDAIISIGKIVRATKYDDRTEQRMFLDAQTLKLVRLNIALSFLSTY